ncbi:unnamed protein product [Lota lota]
MLGVLIMELGCDRMPKTTNMGDHGGGGGGAVGWGLVMTPMVVSSFQPQPSALSPYPSDPSAMVGSLGGRPVALIASRSECDTQWDLGGDLRGKEQAAQQS